MSRLSKSASRTVAQPPADAKGLKGDAVALELPLDHVLIDPGQAGKQQVAVDPVGARPGNYVFMVSGSAARFATGDFDILTDLTIGGIIDRWEEESALIEANRASATA